MPPSYPGLGTARGSAALVSCTCENSRPVFSAQPSAPGPGLHAADQAAVRIARNDRGSNPIRSDDCTIQSRLNAVDRFAVLPVASRPTVYETPAAAIRSPSYVASINICPTNVRPLSIRIDTMWPSRLGNSLRRDPAAAVAARVS